MKLERLNKFISEAIAVEARNAKEVGALGFMARSLVQASLPHRNIKDREFQRQNGAFKLVIMAQKEIGLPYGVIPRLLLAWLTTEALRLKQREIILDNNLSNFLSDLGLISSGGRWGTITRLKEQIHLH